MRYIDMDQLEVPVGWQARADAALDALRNEIDQAEVQATAAGLDPVQARQSAIRSGLKVQGRVDVWRELSPSLSVLGGGKCWYSESRNPTADKNVDHFRPKGRVEEDATHEGYWWLAFRWRNYRYASQWCNQRRVDNVNDTRGGKGDRFPLAAGSVRARAEADNWEDEDVELLDPADPEDWKLLSFRSDGRPTPTMPQGTREHERAAASIEIYHLNCKELVDERRPLAGRIERIVEEMERLRPEITTNLKSRGFYKRQLKELLALISIRSDYSAAALAYARAQVYKREGAHQVKRDWLEEILHSHP